MERIFTKLKQSRVIPDGRDVQVARVGRAGEGSSPWHLGGCFGCSQSHSPCWQHLGLGPRAVGCAGKPPGKIKKQFIN